LRYIMYLNTIWLSSLSSVTGVESNGKARHTRSGKRSVRVDVSICVPSLPPQHSM
ncbi:hypothetical protein L9F63_022006, partial [Diploptera punctata]